MQLRSKTNSPVPVSVSAQENRLKKRTHPVQSYNMKVKQPTPKKYF